MTTSPPAHESNTQAARVARKFGGFPKLHAAMCRHGYRIDLSTVYRWNMPRSKGGTGGLIPSSALEDVLETARLEGVVITAAGLYGAKG